MNANPDYFYEIRVRARLDPYWKAWFEGLALQTLPDGETLISGPIRDQAALHGVLARIRDLGLPLVSVVCTRPAGGRTAEMR